MRALLREQAPAYADRPLVPGPTGWDNTHWVMGDLAVRLPRRAIAVPLVANEVTVLRALADGLPLPVPTPVYVGTPSAVWPWPWTIVPWFDAERADLAYPPPQPHEHGVALGGLLRALHVPAPVGAPRNAYRGIPLADRAERTEGAFQRVTDAGLLDVGGIAVLRAAWTTGLSAPSHSGPATWIHGDLHPGNQLVRDGRLHAVVDWGDAAAGDPATDIASAWWTLPRDGHEGFRDAYGGIDEAMWDRGIGWAAAISAVVLADGVAAGDPAIVGIAHRTVQRLSGG